MCVVKNRSHSSIFSSVLWNVAGAGLPLLVALYSIPKLVSGYGSERYGLLSIIWVLIGYFSIFDLGLGRALTKTVAERLGRGDSQEIPVYVRTGLWIIGGLGCVFGVTLFLCAPWIIGKALSLRQDVYAEGVFATRVMALTLPSVLLSSALIGVLEAYGEFRSINITRLAMGVVNFIGPVIALNWSSSLVLATAILACARFLTTGRYLKQVTATGSLPHLFGTPDRSAFSELFSFGAWVTVSNIVSPLMSQLDKLVVGSLLAVAVLPFYSVPADMILRAEFLPAALVGVLFPVFAAAFSKKDSNCGKLFATSNKVMLLAIAPIVAGVYWLGGDALRMWMGADFAKQSAGIVEFLACGFLANCMARVPFVFIQGAGRPDVTTKLHLLEAPLYFFALYIFLPRFGVMGAAMAWSLRAFVDMCLLYLASAILFEGTRASSTLYVAVTVGVLAGVGVFGALDFLAPKIFTLVVIVGVCWSISVRQLFQMKAEIA